MIPSKFGPYVPQVGDAKNEKKNGEGKVEQVLLSRNGQEMGWLIGPKRDTLVTYESLQGDPLLSDTTAYEWPLNEAYWDIFLYPAVNEPTIHQTLGPNAYVWGYLAARK